jgi:hypothetical protein
MKKLLPEIIVLGVLLLVVRYRFAQAWGKMPSSNFIASFFAESADGRVILSAGSGAVLSTNWGASWSQISDNAFASPGMSADGRVMITEFVTNRPSYAAYIDISTNTGLTWTQTILPYTNWTACS